MSLKDISKRNTLYTEVSASKVYHIFKFMVLATLLYLHSKIIKKYCGISYS